MAFIDTHSTIRPSSREARRGRVAPILSVLGSWIADMLDGIGSGDETVRQQPETDWDLPVHHPVRDER